MQINLAACCFLKKLTLLCTPRQLSKATFPWIANTKLELSFPSQILVEGQWGFSLSSHPGLVIPQVSQRKIWHIPWAVGVQQSVPTPIFVAGCTVTWWVASGVSNRRSSWLTQVLSEENQSPNTAHSTNAEQILESSYSFWLFVKICRLYIL